VAKRKNSRRYNHSKEGEAFGLKIRALRKERKMTYQALADEADVDLSTIYRIEKAQVIITLDLLFGLAKALNVKPKDLLDF
jgi:transcriptional regulator with XRE-family HTH domain